MRLGAGKTGACERFLTRLSATGRTRCGKLSAHFLDLRSLFFHRRSEGCDLFLQLRNRPSLFLHSAMRAAEPRCVSSGH